MCGRTACTLCPDDIQKACSYRDKARGKFKKPEWKEHKGTTHPYKPSYNLAPTDVIPVLLSGSQFESESERVLQPMIWGLIPSWHKGDPKTHGLTTHNCRLEGITSSKLYAGIFKRGHRCVVVCDGFFEWQTTKGKANKQPYFIYMPQPNGIKIEDPDTWSDECDEDIGWKGPQLIKMAGLYDKWKSPDGEDLFSCTVLTTDANETLSWLHHRMPVILETDEQVAGWLDAEGVPANEALSLLTPVKMLAWHPVSTIVNNSRNKVPECIKPLDLTKPEVKKSASGSFMDSWIKKANTPVKRESHSNSPNAKHVKTEPKDSPVLKETPVKQESYSKSPNAKHVKTEPKDSPVLKEIPVKQESHSKSPNAKHVKTEPKDSPVLKEIPVKQESHSKSPNAKHVKTEPKDFLF